MARGSWLRWTLARDRGLTGGGPIGELHLDFAWVEFLATSTAQGFEALSAGLTGAVNGAWQVPDADGGKGVVAFAQKDSLWHGRRKLARAFWSEAPDVVSPHTPQ